MTKIKKRFALMMVLVMAMTMLALPASASTDGENSVEPRYVVVSCPSCGGDAVFSRRVIDERYGSSPVAENICPTESDAHSHYLYRSYDLYVCNSCGHTFKINYSYSKKCPYA